VVLVDVAVGELFATQLTPVGLVLAVDHLVSRHLVQALEGAAADLTGVRPLLWGSTQGGGVSLGGGGATGRRGRGLLTRVCDHVTLQLVGGDELLVARVAVQHFMNLQRPEERRIQGPSDR